MIRQKYEPGTLAPVCWAMSEGHVGMEVQCIGLARALGFEPLVKRIAIRRPWRWIPPRFVAAPLAGVDSTGDSLTPPWPDVLITCGRQVVAPAAAIRRLNGGQTFAIHIQDPKLPLSRFDVVVAPTHDELRGDNVVTSRGGLNQITPDRLAEAADAFAGRYADLPRPLIGVLIGGSNRVYRITPETMQRLGGQLTALAHRHGAGLAITPSRRTGATNEAALRAALQGAPAEIWDGEGPNPYFGILALADALIVTCDSVNMVSEAASTGKPVHVVELEGGSPKFSRFHEALYRDGITRPFSGSLECWNYEALDETTRVAAEIRKRMPDRLRDRLAA